MKSYGFSSMLLLLLRLSVVSLVVDRLAFDSRLANAVYFNAFDTISSICYYFFFLFENAKWELYTLYSFRTVKEMKNKIYQPIERQIAFASFLKVTWEHKPDYSGRHHSRMLKSFVTRCGFGILSLWLISVIRKKAKSIFFSSFV